MAGKIFKINLDLFLYLAARLSSGEEAVKGGTLRLCWLPGCVLRVNALDSDAGTQEMPHGWRSDLGKKLARGCEKVLFFFTSPDGQREQGRLCQNKNG